MAVGLYVTEVSRSRVWSVHVTSQNRDCQQRIRSNSFALFNNQCSNIILIRLKIFCQCVFTTGENTRIGVQTLWLWLNFKQLSHSFCAFMKARCCSDHKNRLEPEAELEKSTVTLQSLRWEPVKLLKPLIFTQEEREWAQGDSQTPTLIWSQIYHSAAVTHSNTLPLSPSLSHTHTHKRFHHVRKWRLGTVLWWQPWRIIWRLNFFSWLLREYY